MPVSFFDREPRALCLKFQFRTFVLLESNFGMGQILVVEALVSVQYWGPCFDEHGTFISWVVRETVALSGPAALKLVNWSLTG